MYHKTTSISAEDICKAAIDKEEAQKPFGIQLVEVCPGGGDSTMLVSIVFAVTEYRPPDDKKVEFYVLNSYADTETMQADFWPAASGAEAGAGEADRHQHQPDGQQQHLRADAVFDVCRGAAGRFVFDFAGRDAQNHFGRRAGIAGGADALSGKRRD